VAAVFSGPSTLRQAQEPQEAAAVGLQQKMARPSLGHLPCADESAAIKKSKIFFMLAQEE
jgi:hypothetical protein